MAKVFVSYKHSDRGVRQLPGAGILFPTTARNYVNMLENLLAHHEHIYKGENDNESLNGFKDETIESKLRNKIFDSSVTVILVSKNMKNPLTAESEQWIPWEISYSLRNKIREDRRSLPNACIAVVLPDEQGSYSYFVEDAGCGQGCISWLTENVFDILRENMFNRRTPNQQTCASHAMHVGDDHSYIVPVLWDEFVNNVDGYIDRAKRLADDTSVFNLKVKI